MASDETLTATAAVASEDSRGEHPAIWDESRSVQLVYQELLRYRRMSLQRGKDCVWPDQASVATRLRLSVRTVRRAINRLEKIRLIRIVPSGRQNRYYFLDTQAATPAKMADQTGQNVRCLADQTGQNVRSLLLGVKKKEESISSSSAANAAAADLFAPLEMQDAHTALVALDVPRDMIPHLVRRHGPEFALLAATYYAERARDPNRSRVKNPVGFIRTLFECPQTFGFSFINGRWEPPPPVASPNPLAAKRAAESARNDAARAKRLEDDRQAAGESAAAIEARTKEWAAAAPELRQAIIADVRRRPLYAGRAPGDFTFDVACWKELQARQSVAGASAD